jgi:chemotaxis protein MotB
MQTRIIIKKKAGHGGHHGGAWKVAYADFVTAMMALFIVLWLMNASKQVQEAIGGYFKDPTGQSKMIGSNLAGSGENFLLRKEDMHKLKEQLEKAIQQVPDLEKLKKQIEITITAEGLRIELLETDKGTFFDLGNATPSPSGKELLSLLAREIGKLQNRVSIEGHTDSKPYQGEKYSNWELSTDRANAARRIMMLAGLSPTQVKQIRGYADQQLRNKDNPEDPANRRISVIVHYVQNGPENQGKELQEEFKSQAPASPAK